MTEKTSTFEFDLDGQTVTVTVARASIRMASRRYQAIVKGHEIDAAAHDPDLEPIRKYIFPDVFAATVSVEGMKWPMTADEYAELPELLDIEWRKHVYEKNPQWHAPVKDEAGDEKKE
jgi:hypothetical protein